MPWGIPKIRETSEICLSWDYPLNRVCDFLSSGFFSIAQQNDKLTFWDV